VLPEVRNEVVIKARTVGESVPPPPLPLATDAVAKDASTAQPLIPKLSAKELQTLVATIALYPDEVLDNILDAVQYPAALRQAANLHRSKQTDTAPQELPGSVKFLLTKHSQVLLDLDKDNLMMARLGAAMKSQPEDVVSAIREVRAQSAALQAQQGDVAASQATTYSLPIASRYYADGGVYAGTSYPCYSYYTYGLPCTYYNGWYDPYVGYYPYYGFGTGLYGYGYGYGYGYPYWWGAARLTLGILYLANGPYYYPYYGFGYPYSGFAYPYAGYAYGGYPAAYPYNRFAATYFGPNGGYATRYGAVGYGPYGGVWGASTTSGVYNLPRGSGTFTSGGIAGKTTIGNTTYFGGAGGVTWSGTNGTGAAGGWLRGNATVIGNTAAWHTQAAGGIQTSTGINAIAAHTGGGSLVAYQDGSYGFNRNATNTYSGNLGSATVNRSQTGHFTGDGTGSYAGTTNITRGNGGGGTVNTTYNNGDFDVNYSPNNASQSAANRLSGQNGVDNRFSSRSSTGLGNSLASSSSSASQGNGMLNQFSRPGDSGATSTPRSAASSNSSRGIGERFGGYGALGGSNSLGSLGSSSVGGGRPLSNNANSGQITNRLGGDAIPGLQGRGASSSGLGSTLGSSGLGSSGPRSSGVGSSGLGSTNRSAPSLGGGLSNNGGGTMFNNLPVTPRSGGGSSFGAGQFRGGATPSMSSPRASAPSFGGGSFGGGSFGGGRSFGGGSIGGGSFGGGGRIGGGSIGGGIGGGRSFGGGGGGGRIGGRR
jgi:hypothetical protein